jgi:hypothetical protein
MFMKPPSGGGSDPSAWWGIGISLVALFLSGLSVLWNIKHTSDRDRKQDERAQKQEDDAKRANLYIYARLTYNKEMQMDETACYLHNRGPADALGVESSGFEKWGPFARVRAHQEVWLFGIMLRINDDEPLKFGVKWEDGLGVHDELFTVKRYEPGEGEIVS